MNIRRDTFIIRTQSKRNGPEASYALNNTSLTQLESVFFYFFFIYMHDNKCRLIQYRYDVVTIRSIIYSNLCLAVMNEGGEGLFKEAENFFSKWCDKTWNFFLCLLAMNWAWKKSVVSMQQHKTTFFDVVSDRTTNRWIKLMV